MVSPVRFHFVRTVQGTHNGREAETQCLGTEVSSGPIAPALGDNSGTLVFHYRVIQDSKLGPEADYPD